MGKDEQVIIEGIIKPCRNNSDREIITGTLQLGLFQIVLIVNVPQDGEERVKIYCKFKVAPPKARGSTRDEYQSNRVADKNEARGYEDEALV